jgi:hypothetical protein
MSRPATWTGKSHNGPTRNKAVMCRGLPTIRVDPAMISEAAPAGRRVRQPDDGGKEDQRTVRRTVLPTIRMHCVDLLAQRLDAQDVDRQVAAFQVPAASHNGFTALGTPIPETVGWVCPGNGRAARRSTCATGPATASVGIPASGRCACAGVRREPNLSQQNRTGFRLISRLRPCISSSTFRNASGNRP